VAFRDVDDFIVQSGKHLLQRLCVELDPAGKVTRIDDL
jgi:hypothetical protein